VTFQPLLRPPALHHAGLPLPVDRPFTMQQARRAGLSRHRVRRLESDSLLRRVMKGVYVANQVADSIRLRLQSLELVVPPDVVVTDWTACWLHTGLLPPNDHLRIPTVCAFRPAGNDRLRNELCSSGERTFQPEDLVAMGALTVTTPLRTAWDLGRLAPRDLAIGGLDTLLRDGGFSHAELVGGVERFKRRRGVVQLRELTPLADPRSESPGESTLRLRWLDLRSLPAPTPQVPVTIDGVEVYRLDLGVPELRYACEYDGEAFHGETHRAKDNARREDLRRRFGWDVDAVRRSNVYGVNRNIEQILYEGIDRARRAGGRSA
jgi:hypothetical protein